VVGQGQRLVSIIATNFQTGHSAIRNEVIFYSYTNLKLGIIYERLLNLSSLIIAITQIKLNKSVLVLQTTDGA